MKPADAVVENGAAVPYPPSTGNFHYEIELVVALGRGGRDIAPQDALGLVFGYAAGNDLTRRDLQSAAKERGEPWDTSKGFDGSAPVAAIRPANAGHVSRGRIWLSVNGKVRQESDISRMVLARGIFEHALIERRSLVPQTRHGAPCCSAGLSALMSATMSVPVPSLVNTSARIPSGER